LKTILYLSYTGMTDPLGQSQVLSYIKELSKSKLNKFVIISFEKPGPFKQLKPIIEQICVENGIEWYPLFYTSKPPVLSTFFNVKKMKRLAVDLHQQYHFSLVHCRSYIPALVGQYLKRSFNIPFLFDMRGFWADERVDGGLWKLSNPIYKIIYKYFKKKEVEFLQEADHVISLTNTAKKEIISWGTPTAPVTVIPCCVDFKLFSPEQITVELQEKAYGDIQIPVGAPVITYLGSLGTWYMLNEMMQLANMYRSKYPDAYFMILTGEPETHVRKVAEEAGFNLNYLRVRKVQRKEVAVYLSLSTLSVFFYLPTYSKKATSPVKQGELMAMGIPVVCNDLIGDSTEIVQKYNAGIVIDKFDHITLEAAIEEIDKSNFSKELIIKGANEVFSLDNGVAAYQNIYNKVINDAE